MCRNDGSFSLGRLNITSRTMRASPWKGGFRSIFLNPLSEVDGSFHQQALTFKFYNVTNAVTIAALFLVSVGPSQELRRKFPTTGLEILLHTLLLFELPSLHLNNITPFKHSLIFILFL